MESGRPSDEEQKATLATENEVNKKTQEAAPKKETRRKNPRECSTETNFASIIRGGRGAKWPLLQLDYFDENFLETATIFASSKHMSNGRL